MRKAVPGATPTSTLTRMAALRIALAQVDSNVGDLRGNAERIRDFVARAAEAGAHVVLLPHMVLTGYPLAGLAYRESFQSAAEETLRLLAEDLAVHRGLTVVLGSLGVTEDDQPFGSVAVVRDGEVTQHNPRGAAATEDATGAVIEVAGTSLGITTASELSVADLVPHHGRGVQALLVLYASPFEVGHRTARDRLRRAFAPQVGVPMVVVNLVGGQDDLIFDGDSCVTDAAGTAVVRAPRFVEHLLLVDLDDDGPRAVDPDHREPAPPDPVADVYEAITLGLRDYVRKNGFSRVVLGLSGGIDSALVAAIACDAVGAAGVIAVSMPSDYSSEHSRQDAAALAEATGLDFRTQSIAPLFDACQAELKLAGTAAENLQARLRGLVLMAISNTEGPLVLAPGNKSELAVGYSTIYGDAVGGYAPIRDIPKSMVWQLARWRNARAREAGEPEPIPQRSISKPPSAELRPDQLDSDSLPDYDVLDPLLQGYLGERRSRAELVDDGFDAALVDRVIGLVAASEWKRRQYPVGPRVTSWALDRDLHLPLTSAWRERS